METNTGFICNPMEKQENNIQLSSIARLCSTGWDSNNGIGFQCIAWKELLQVSWKEKCFSHGCVRVSKEECPNRL